MAAFTEGKDLLCPCAKAILYPNGSSSSSTVAQLLQLAVASEAQPGFVIDFQYSGKGYLAVLAQQPGAGTCSWGVVGHRGQRPHCYICHRGTCQHIEELVEGNFIEDPGSRHSMRPEVWEQRRVGLCQLNSSVSLKLCRSGCARRPRPPHETHRCTRSSGREALPGRRMSLLALTEHRAALHSRFA